VGDGFSAPQRARVPEYWIVDLDACPVERWRPDDERPEVLANRLTWEPVRGGGVHELDLTAFLAELWGDDASPC